jgi:hypothetical protein
VTRAPPRHRRHPSPSAVGKASGPPSIVSSSRV